MYIEVNDSESRFEFLQWASVMFQAPIIIKVVKASHPVLAKPTPDSTSPANNASWFLVESDSYCLDYKAAAPSAPGRLTLDCRETTPAGQRRALKLRRVRRILRKTRDASQGAGPAPQFNQVVQGSALRRSRHAG